MREKVDVEEIDQEGDNAKAQPALKITFQLLDKRLARFHRKLSHASNRLFVLFFKQCGALSWAIDYARIFRCEICHRDQTKAPEEMIMVGEGTLQIVVEIIRLVLRALKPTLVEKVSALGCHWIAHYGVTVKTRTEFEGAFSKFELHTKAMVHGTWNYGVESYICAGSLDDSQVRDIPQLGSSRQSWRKSCEPIP